MDGSIKVCISILITIISGCSLGSKKLFVQDLSGKHEASLDQIWLSHEHILVDFIGADSIDSNDWSQALVIEEMTPYLEELKQFNVTYFVDATPNFLGRDVLLLEKIANRTGLKILTNTGLYGVRNNQFIPDYAKKATAKELSEMWIQEFDVGIDGSSIRPGFIKIGIDKADPLTPMHNKLIEAAALTHLETGMAIASHTGKAKGLWPQLAQLKSLRVSPEAFIWVHAQAEDNPEEYLKAAATGCWISLDGLGWDLEKILFAKKHGFLNRILIAHDAGWYDPQKDKQSIQGFTNIFTQLIPALKAHDFTDEDIKLLLSTNPAQAFSIRIRKVK
ncbi:phosphotriesterase family protein [Cyclobacterium qasimii]|uniref:Aryldialkylphosphatase n=2 Tax=Cyclobacterium qasimii TaxID=1350429 RepID=A0A512CBQ1_9BACT|nr:phosphotriesterase [Cyclobacterium qasimii]EPR67257.1 putative phosphotriesterase [Cyclobacterium qasimii M12-11B]GEO21597.1 aryldialkylphosphatase [Cyclobacterium qasimii]